jgi:hypothetical protein
MYCQLRHARDAFTDSKFALFSNEKSGLAFRVLDNITFTSNCSELESRAFSFIKQQN